MNYESPSKLRRLSAVAQIQESLPGFSLLDDAIFAMASSGVEERGAVYTRREVAEFILDLVGFTPDRALADFRLLEPSFGGGDFLLPAVDRLLDSFERSGGRAGDAMSLADALRGVELHADAHAAGLRAVVDLLVGRGVKGAVAERLAVAWLRQGDFLLAGGLGTFTHVVGNPPYVRQESIPAVLIAEYRRRFTTIYDRADLYVPFFERGLRLLREDGKLGYICSDRWMKNRYGGPLRELVADGFHLQSYVDMYDTPAFLSDVVAYPAITVIGQGAGDETRVVKRPSVDRETLRPLAAELSGDAAPGPDVRVCAGIVRGSEPWIFDATSTLDLVRRLEASLPELEAAGCRVGIGVATGADAAFTGPFDALDVEDDRKLRMATTRDIRDGTVRWRGTGVINPFDASGKLVALGEHPRLRAYLEARRDAIAGRHVAKKSPDRWYRTIDRIDPTLAARPKLLVPDIKGSAHIVYEDEGLYPHHNLYYVVSDEWDLHALRAVLVSGIARLFVATYSTRMRGGYLRFQAQYLRRIRVPHWRDVPPDIRKALAEASIADDRAGCDAATVALYGLSEAEQKLMSEQA